MLGLVLTQASAQVMKYAGVKIVAIPRTTSPKALQTSAMLVEVQTVGSYNPLTLMHFELRGAAQNRLLQGTKAKVYYTGTKDSFSTALEYGTPRIKNGRLLIDGEQLLQNGSNYFWITTEGGEKSNERISALHFISCTTGLSTYQTTWADEFSTDGPPDSANWNFEHGFVRNSEDQWYQEQNVFCKNGLLTIEARRDSLPNPRYEEGSRDWRRNRKFIHYTSASINTRGKRAWTYGRLEMRARLDTNGGCWPAWWVLGTEGGEWPNNGEIDMMEFYRGKILANYALGTQKQYTAKWYSTATTPAKFERKAWADSFHLWRMDWDSAGIAIYLDEVLLNYQPQSLLYNRNGNNNYFPFRHPQYMLLNFAIGGQNGGDPSITTFPRQYDVDYVRVLQKVKDRFTDKTIHYK